MSILQEKNGADPELLVYTVTLINKVCKEEGEGDPRPVPGSSVSCHLVPSSLSVDLQMLAP